MLWCRTSPRCSSKKGGWFTSEEKIKMIKDRTDEKLQEEEEAVQRRQDKEKKRAEKQKLKEETALAKAAKKKEKETKLEEDMALRVSQMMQVMGNDFKSCDQRDVHRFRDIMKRKDLVDLEKYLTGASVPRTFHRISLSKAKSVVKHVLVNVWGAGVAP